MPLVCKDCSTAVHSSERSMEFLVDEGRTIVLSGECLRVDFSFRNVF